MYETEQNISSLPPALDVVGLTKDYPTAAGPFRALDGVDLRLGAGSLIAVAGRSGSGKTTLLNLIGGLDRPTAGTVRVAGTSVEQLPEGERSVWRCRHVGFVFQSYLLLPTLTAAENIILPMDFAGSRPRAQRRPAALELLDQVGIADQADKFPGALSGGQQQRVAIARALANDPPLIVADEPTGNLDSRTAAQALDLLSALADRGRAVLVVSHDPGIGAWADRTVWIEDGRIAETTSPEPPSHGGREAVTGATR